MKINELLQSKNIGKIFKINASGEEFEVCTLNGLLGLRRVEDNKDITEVFCLHIILLSEFEEVKPNTDDLLDLLEEFDLDYEDDGKTIKFEGEKFERMIHKLFLT